MKTIIYNIGYFLKEVLKIIRLNQLSNLLSLFSTGLIFFIFAMVISGWWISSEVIEAIQGEAEINVYYEEGINNEDALKLVERIAGMEGIREARRVDEAEAYGRMVAILGKDARVLEFFDDNPFSPFIEVKIHLDQMDSIIGVLAEQPGIDYIRDNREILDRLRQIDEIVKLLGYLVVAAVGISTLVIISHIIRQGIYNNREQINTLRLLGAPEAFIALPFILVGLMITLGGGTMATVLAVFALRQVYALMMGPLPFIPLPPHEIFISNLVTLVMISSAVLGIVGSFFGLSSAKSN